MNKRYQQGVALAAVFQAASLVEQLARTGEIPASEFELLINSLFIQNPDNFDEIYGQIPNLQAGAHAILKSSSGIQNALNPDVMRYALSILHLENKLKKQHHLLDVIGKGIEHAQLQSKHFSITHENILANLSSTYQKSLSTLNFRIKVTGNPNILKNANQADKIRVLLLAGVRAAILWRQVGGRRWHLLFSRKSYCKIAQGLLNNSIED